MLKLISGDTLLKIGQAMPVRAGKECNRAWGEADYTYLYSSEEPTKNVVF